MAKAEKTLEERREELAERERKLEEDRIALQKETLKVPAHLVAPMEQHIDQSGGNHTQEDSHEPLPAPDEIHDHVLPPQEDDQSETPAGVIPPPKK